MERETPAYNSALVSSAGLKIAAPMAWRMSCMDVRTDPRNGMAGILVSGPAVGHLCGIGQCFGHCLPITATAISGHDGNLRMTGKPCPGGLLLAVWQQGDDPVLFQIADNDAVTLVFPSGPVVNPDHIERFRECPGTPTDNS